MAAVFCRSRYFVHAWATEFCTESWHAWRICAVWVAAS
jgi:hypothetical protein